MTYFALPKIQVSFPKRLRQKKLLVNILWPQRERRIKNILKQEIVFGRRIFSQTHPNICNRFITDPLARIDRMWCYLPNNKMRSAFAQCEVPNSVKESHTRFVKSPFNTTIKHVQHMSMSQRRNCSSQCKAESQSLKPVSVEQADVELKHIRKKVLWNIAAQQCAYLLSRIRTIMHLDHFNKSMQCSSTRPTESSRMNLQPFTYPIHFSKLSKKGGSEFRLLDNTNEKLQNDFTIMHVLLIGKRISEVIEEPQKSKKGLSSNRDIAVLSESHESWQNYTQQDNICTVSGYHSQELYSQEFAGHILAPSYA